MRLNQIVLPDFAAGYPAELPVGLPADLAIAEHALLATFGGFTATPGQGVWLDDAGHIHRGPVRVYHIAETVDHAADRLRDFASWFAATHNQQCVYVEINGEAEFVEPAQEPIANEA
jgi:hypothetical protein